MEFSDAEVREELAKYGYHDFSQERLKEFKKDLMALISRDRRGSSTSSVGLGTEFTEGNFSNHGSQWIEDGYLDDSPVDLEDWCLAQGFYQHREHDDAEQLEYNQIDGEPSEEVVLEGIPPDSFHGLSSKVLQFSPEICQNEEAPSEIYLDGASSEICLERVPPEMCHKVPSEICPEMPAEMCQQEVSSQPYQAEVTTSDMCQHHSIPSMTSVPERVLLDLHGGEETKDSASRGDADPYSGPPPVAPSVEASFVSSVSTSYCESTATTRATPPNKNRNNPHRTRSQSKGANSSNAEGSEVPSTIPERKAYQRNVEFENCQQGSHGEKCNALREPGRPDVSFAHRQTESIFEIYEQIKNQQQAERCVGVCGKKKPKKKFSFESHSSMDLIKGGKFKKNRKWGVAYGQKLPPHELNRKTHSPSERQAFYERAWAAQPPPGESNREDLVKALHRKFVAQDKKFNVKPDPKVYIRNMYVTPDKKIRQSMRFRIRNQMNNYEMPEVGLFHDVQEFDKRSLIW